MAHPRRNDFLIPTLGVVFDAIAIECAFLLSYWLRFDTPIFNFLPITEGRPSLDAYVYGSFVVIPVWLMLFKNRGMYGARRNVSLIDEFLNIVRLVTIGMLIVMSAAFFYRAFSYSRVVFGLLWIASVKLVTIDRILLYDIEKRIYRRGKELRNAVIIGNNETANRVFSSFYNHPLLGYRLEGYFANNASPDGTPIAHLRYFGTLGEVADKLVSEHIELALIALDHADHSAMLKLIEECEGVNVEFLMVPDILEIMASSLAVKEIEGIPFIRIKGVPMTTWGRVLKRMFDIVVAFVLLVISSPLFLLVTLLIWINSRGAVLFRQDRVGLDGRKFSMIKFRSMKAGAEQFDEQAGLGIANDPRQTGVGRFLRRTSLDELPQLFNVVKGEMSLVGPRPERPYFVEQFKSMIPKYLDRHRVKTGMTGWAQVNGFRGDSSLRERIKYDIYYIENWSLGFDVKILLKTFKALL